MEKKKVLPFILMLMDEVGATVDDIREAQILARRSKYADERFDLLVEVEGERRRVPFEEGKTMKPIGLFPRNSSRFFILFGVSQPAPYPDELRSQMADKHVAEKVIAPVLPELNAKLKEVGIAPLSGRYWIDGMEHSGNGYWVLVCNKLSGDVTYLDERHKAQILLGGYL